MIRKDTDQAFQWRIRNCFFPAQVYSVDIDANEIIVRTSNKKYYKRIPIPDMQRLQQKLEKKYLEYSHANNTLLISVRICKPYLLLLLVQETTRPVAIRARCALQIGRNETPKGTTWRWCQLQTAIKTAICSHTMRAHKKHFGTSNVSTQKCTNMCQVWRCTLLCCFFCYYYYYLYMTVWPYQVKNI